MKVLSLFSGVGGFDLGLEAAGMETVALCEWDRHAQSILRRHWPNTPLYGDVSELTGAQLIADGVYPDLVAFGSPCQDLSVAGKRAGLAGERSGLFHEATRIIRELRTLTDGTLPRWVVWENVVGALNSNAGADFGAVLDEMGNLGAHLIEWAVLDAQNYGVPQRRRRVFLVACLDPRTSARCPDPLLPVGQGSPRDLAPLREAWKASPAGSAGRARDVGLIDATRVGDVRIYPEPVQTLKARMGTGGNTVPLTFTKARRAQSPDDFETWVEGDPAPTVNTFDQGDIRATTLAVSWWDGGDQADTLTTTSDAQRMPDKQRLQAVIVPEITGTLDAQEGTKWGSHQWVGQDRMIVYGVQGSMIGRQDHNGPQGSGISDHGEPMFTLTSTDRHAVVPIGFSAGNSAAARSIALTVDGTPPLKAGPSGTNQVPTVVTTELVVRRLTPRECERLMGWPDDWTRWTDTGKEQADSHRYKQCGNGVASPVAEWVGRQIFAAEHFGQ